MPFERAAKRQIGFCVWSARKNKLGLNVKELKRNFGTSLKVKQDLELNNGTF